MAGDERTKQARENLVKMMLADMEREGMNWSRSWCAGEPFNPVTGTHYSGRNALLLTYYMREEHMTDPRFMTFRQAKDRGCKIAKGCHSFAIEKWRELFFDASDKSRKVKQPRNEEERRAQGASKAPCESPTRPRFEGAGGGARDPAIPTACPSPGIVLALSCNGPKPPDACDSPAIQNSAKAPRATH